MPGWSDIISQHIEKAAKVRFSNNDFGGFFFARAIRYRDKTESIVKNGCKVIMNTPFE
jgi:hypothetical protein